MIKDQKYLLFLIKLPFAKDYILKISQQSTLNIPKLPNAEIVSGYEISVCTLQQQQKCINSLKIIHYKEQKISNFVNIFFEVYTNYQIRRCATLQIFLVEHALYYCSVLTD